MNFATLEVARHVMVWVAASDLSAEARTPWIVFILDDCAYFSRGFMNHLDYFHLLSSHKKSPYTMFSERNLPSVVPLSFGVILLRLACLPRARGNARRVGG